MKKIDFSLRHQGYLPISSLRDKSPIPKMVRDAAMHEWKACPMEILLKVRDYEMKKRLSVVVIRRLFIFLWIF